MIKAIFFYIINFFRKRIYIYKDIYYIIGKLISLKLIKFKINF